MAIFQLIVDTYAIPHYKEANPAVFTIVSFPFLFGVMFGDIYHGFIMLIFCTWLLLTGDKGPIASALAPAKYIFFLMACYSLFCGFIYNDFTSMTTQIFGESCWEEDEGKTLANGSKMMKRTDKDCVYPVGIDPVWYRSNEEVQYLNSFKMKTAVIYGVAQMLLGTCVKILNACYFGDPIKLIFVGFAQLFMMLAMFGLMDYLIIVKWLTDWDPVMAQGSEPPGIINLMVAMFLSGGQLPEGDTLFADIIPNQAIIMQTLLKVVLLCVPSMLLVEPIYEYCHHMKEYKKSLVEEEDVGKRI